MRGYYGLIQYCPNPSRAEGANIGVVLFCPEANYLDVMMSAGNDRARKLFSGASFDVDRLNAAKSSFANRLRAAGQEFRSVADLEQFMRTRGNALQIVPPRPVKVDEPATALRQLFAELVGGRSKAKAPKVLFPELEAAFRAPELASRVEFKRPVTVPIVERSFIAPYAFVNGRVNVVLTQHFAADPNSAKHLAARLAVEGDLLIRHADTQLVVVARFEGDASSDAPAHVQRLFEEYRTRLVGSTYIASFVAEVAASAH